MNIFTVFFRHYQRSGSGSGRTESVEVAEGGGRSSRTSFAELGSSPNTHVYARFFFTLASIIPSKIRQSIDFEVDQRFLSILIHYDSKNTNFSLILHFGSKELHYSMIFLFHI